MSPKKIWIFIMLAALLAGCGRAQAGGPVAAASPAAQAAASAEITQETAAPVLGPTAGPEQPTASGSAPAGAKPAVTAPPEAVPAAAAPTPAPTLAPGAWKDLPVIPEVGPRAAEIFRRGQELGLNAQAFSKVGDCGSTPAWFLGDFDRGPRYYRLGEYTALEGVIQQFQGSFSRTSLAAKAGFNASSVFTVLWADRAQCDRDETPLACEYRLNRPAVALITLGTNDVYHLDTFEVQMRRIIDFSIESGVIPVLATKPDNLEGNEQVNTTIAALAQEYGLPLWNYWRAVQDLPDGGLQEDAAHITWGPNQFDDPQAMRKGWPVRNLTALQALDAVWRGAMQGN